ncbi:transcription-repair coupling factor [Agromyces fucosus]|uniref:Transcription-repair-coupling factor n=1 Tax=Agromyces fucosus TaxID=41985 RepID=A0A4Q2JJP8_9MICO|nr:MULTISPECIES: transcription-repair coupling factor [Agromyces]KQZ07719.1 transcription-repair coupling factor [Agromyces sp. Root1464]RXZ46749.1 transcription-repair coupling factor [Agromyces fucosus]
MNLQGFLTALSRAETIDAALAEAQRNADFSAPAGLDAPLIAGLLQRRADAGLPPALLAVTATSREGESLRASLAPYLPDAELIEFPAWETLPHERLSPSAETVGRRLHAIRRMHDWAAEGSRHPLVVVASVRAALQPLADNLASLDPVELVAGGRGYNLAELAVRLVDLAYARVDMVARRGEFAVRGGILDVFPPTADHPVRVEFFGDEVEELRAFSVADQRSLPDVVERVSLPPSRELLLTEPVRQRAREMVHEFPSLAGLLEKVSEGIPVEGMESLAPALLERLVPLAHYLPQGAAVAVLEPERVAGRAVNLGETNREFLAAAWNAATAGAAAPIDLAAGDFLTVRELRDAVLFSTPGQPDPQRVWWNFSGFDMGDAAEVVAAAGGGAAGGEAESQLTSATTTVRVVANAMPSFQGNVAGAVDHAAERLRDGWTLVVASAGHGLVERARDVLAEAGLAARLVDDVPAELEPGVAYLVQADAAHGYEVPGVKLGLLAESEFYGRAAGYDARQGKKLASRRRNVVDPLQLKAGDFVVHQTHGIGKFIEMVQREVATGARPTGPSRTAGIQQQPTAVREYLVIEYAPSKRGHAGDRLFVPTDQLDLLSRYVGGEAPSLSKMGGSDWAQAKGKARKAVRDIAVSLVKLYSARMASKGHAFGPDTPWQHELEEAFPFTETPDQLQTIDEVKADMERSIPMDRLLAGDVGFGKTEVAVRAAFKAIQEGKQVAMLVPTTLLVKQHLETFTERYAGFPVHVRALSRFQSDKEARDTIAGLADGTVDMVIGTHRILTEKVTFKDVGLVIIDEEQRFGVEHKDALKKLKTNVDILAMSATPIPRSLEMAVTGIREMSTLATPPEDRHPILTFVGPYSDQQVAAAIRREMLREGQVFFVHNRVSSINRVAAQLAELVPEARIAVAHGQLNEHVLEQIVNDFWERKFDVLVSTTIIETGLDITNANTIIIDRADKYGLSQLHQLRGRVGRGRERAYGYFLYDPAKPLSETAHDRLSTIAANNELGSGMQVALKDLEIRGAGNLLGAEQAGHIAGVGFDLYLRMIGEAVSAFRGDVATGQTELRLELPVDAHIPEDYVDSERLRLEAYQKLSAASGPAAKDGQIDQVVDELVDRYGEPPEQVKHLVAISRLRREAQRAGLSDVIATGSKLRIAPANIPDSRRVRLERMYPGAKHFAQNDVILVPFPVTNGELPSDADLIDWVSRLIIAIFPIPEAPATDAAGQASTAAPGS